MIEDGLPAAAAGQDLVDVVAVNERGPSCAAAVLLLDQPRVVIEVTRFSRICDLHDPAAKRIVSIFAYHHGVRASRGADQTILFIIVVTESSILDQVSVPVVTKGDVVDRRDLVDDIMGPALRNSVGGLAAPVAHRVEVVLSLRDGNRNP